MADNHSSSIFVVSPTESVLLGMCIGSFRGQQDATFMKTARSILTGVVPEFGFLAESRLGKEDLPEDLIVLRRGWRALGVSPTVPWTLYADRIGWKAITWKSQRSSLVDLLFFYLGDCCKLDSAERIIYNCLTTDRFVDDWGSIISLFRLGHSAVSELTVEGDDDAEKIEKKISELVRESRHVDLFQLGQTFAELENMLYKSLRSEMPRWGEIDTDDGCPFGVAIAPQPFPDEVLDIAKSLRSSSLMSCSPIAMEMIARIVSITSSENDEWDRMLRIAISQDDPDLDIVENEQPYSGQSDIDASPEGGDSSGINDIEERQFFQKRDAQELADYQGRRSEKGLEREKLECLKCTWIALGEIIGILRESDQRVREQHANSFVSRAYDWNSASVNEIRKKIYNMSTQLDQNNVEADDIVRSLVWAVESLTRRRWPSEADDLGIGPILRKSLQSEDQSRQRFGHIGYSLWRAYRNAAYHGTLNCSYAEARYVLSAVAALVDLCEAE